MSERILKSIICFLLLLNYNSCAQNNQNRTINNHKSNKKVIFILFDPTIFKQNEKKNYDEMMDRFKQFYMNIPQSTEIKVWVIEDGLMNKGVTFQDTFRFAGTQREEENLPKHKIESFNRLKVVLDSKWTKYHNNDLFSKPTSCILTGIYLLSQKNADFFNPINNSINYRIYVLVVSDMVELCRDWNIPTAIDSKYFNSLNNFQVPVKTDLAMIYRMMIIKEPNEQVSSIQDNISLQNFWTKIARAFGVEEKNFFYRYDFSNDFFN